MDQTENVVAHYTTLTKFPNGLKNVEEAAEAIMIHPSKLKELADMFYVPHIRIDDREEYFFRIAELRAWAAENLVRSYAGVRLPLHVRVCREPLPAQDPPESLKDVKALREIQNYDCVPGVYFLINGSRVVYVGQSMTPAQRIARHAASPDKQFDRVLLLPVPTDQLTDVEGAFIRALEPEMNGGNGKGLKACGHPENDQDILKEYTG